MFKYLNSFILLFIFVHLVVSNPTAKKSYKTRRECGQTKPILYKESEKSHRLVEIVFLDNKIVDCYLYGDKRLAEKSISEKLCRPKAQLVGAKEFAERALQCSEWLTTQIRKGLIPVFSDQDFPDEYNNKIDRNFFDGILIYPGTKWCGAGDIAEDYDDLGSERETDICCRRHDLCFDSIPASDSKYNLTNKAIHTKSHCYCDQEFKDCLKSVDRFASNTIAELYYNLIQVQCFQKDHPIVKCLEWRGIPFFWESCQRYELDYMKAIIYQFFDSKFVD